jgi:hypothetical protein
LNTLGSLAMERHYNSISNQSEVIAHLELHIEVFKTFLIF